MKQEGRENTADHWTNIAVLLESKTADCKLATGGARDSAASSSSKPLGGGQFGSHRERVLAVSQNPFCYPASSVAVMGTKVTAWAF